MPVTTARRPRVAGAVLDPRYVVCLLTQVMSDQVTIVLGGEPDPGLSRPLTGEDYLGVVTPVKIWRWSPGALRCRGDREAKAVPRGRRGAALPRRPGSAAVFALAARRARTARASRWFPGSPRRYPAP
ncbi:MAG TPA: hypothetical protein VFT22_35005 [Kofleriaceae bacterium]|nr:hypothetical protein [Kofleriaceae bacterium]